MNILMVSNVFTPQIGGVTRSIQQFCEEFRSQGHRVLVIAPRYQEAQENEDDVIRVPAIPNFYLNQYSLPLPVFSTLIPEVRNFRPEIVHVHHPFLMGSVGLQIAADQNIPLVYTHHTRYSVYIETKTDWPSFVEEGLLELIVGFCELCDGVVAPSAGIQDLLRQNGITARIEVIPTGVDLQRFAHVSSATLRQRLALPENAFIVGHVGRLSPEKNTSFLTQAVAAFLKDNPVAEFVVVGDGPDRENMEILLLQEGLSDRCHFLGFLEGDELADAYAGFDVFAFASHSETQGMVITEAMAAGTPVVAVNATGVCDVIVDGVNGRLIPRDDIAAFAEGLKSISVMGDQEFAGWRQRALQSAQEMSQLACTIQMLNLYSELIAGPRSTPANEWERLQQRWEARWRLWRLRVRAMGVAARKTLSPPDEPRSMPGD